MKTLKRFIIVVIVCVFSFALWPEQSVLGQDTPPPPDLQAAALEYAAVSRGLDRTEIAELTSAESQFERQGRTVYSFKYLDKELNEVFIVSVDESGEPVDTNLLVEQERAAAEAQYGRIDPKLYSVLEGAGANQLVPVVIWMNEPVGEPPARPEMDGLTPEQAQNVMQSNDQSRAATVAELVKPVKNNLESMGFKAMPNDAAPILSVSLPPSIVPTVAAWPEVRMVYLEEIALPSIESAWDFSGVGAMYVRRMIGRGANVGINEVGHGTSPGNPYLAPVTTDGTYVGACTPASHETGVAGIIHSSHPTRTGFAMGSELWVGGSCTGNLTELQNQGSSASTWGARAINNSWNIYCSSTTPGSSDLFFDTLVYNNALSVIFSAGNSYTCEGVTSHQVFSPALGYNLISVGAYDDAGTGGWADDFMATYSNYTDPSSTHGDREKPEVSAPGSNYNSTTTTAPWTGSIGSGTSFAAPVVTAFAANLMQRDNTIMYWPEEVKAMMIAGASHNIEGDPRLSDLDGAGAVHGRTLDDIARKYGAGHGRMSYYCSTASPVTLATVWLVGGRQTRIAIAWDNPPSYPSYASQPSADLDLEVSNGVTTVWSSSWDNTFEIVKFTPAVSANYTIKVYRTRCDQDPSYLGYAWWYSP